MAVAASRVAIVPTKKHRITFMTTRADCRQPIRVARSQQQVELGCPCGADGADRCATPKYVSHGIGIEGHLFVGGVGASCSVHAAAKAPMKHALV